MSALGDSEPLWWPVRLTASTPLPEASPPLPADQCTADDAFPCVCVDSALAPVGFSCRDCRRFSLRRPPLAGPRR